MQSPPRQRLQTIARRVMTERGLAPDFTQAALLELAALRAAPPVATPDGAAVRDMRALAWASIDNDDSRDLDQLSVAEAGADGVVRVWVAIADVDVAVKRGSAIDEHARVNTTSVYTAAQVFPMLPEELSTDLTSLGQDVDRAALVIEMTVAPDGAVASSDVFRAVVRNRAKLAYNAVAAWLDGTTPPPQRVAAVPGLDANLRLQDRAAQAMRALRHSHGALSLETLEVRPVFEADEVKDLQVDKDNRAKQLIENFMVAANGAVVQFLVQHRFPSIRRVLRLPERWGRIVDLAAALGETLPAEPNASALEAFLTKRRDEKPARFADLSLSVIKLLGRGEYVSQRSQQVGSTAEGHFGLAVNDYTHSTAPNRRFPDLVTQRLVKAALSGQPSPYTDDELSVLARRCTEQEDNAAKVERQVRKSAAAMLLSNRVGERFEAIVTGASPKGTWVRITHPAVEGKVMQGAAGIDVGDHVSVELLRVDIDRGLIDFARVGV